MRKKCIWVCIIVGIVIAALLLPHLMLWLEQENAESRVLTNANAAFLNLDELSVAKKQALLASGELTLVSDATDNESDILQSFYTELSRLHECGALSENRSEIIQNLFAEDVAAVSAVLAFDRSGNNAYSYYQIDGSHALAIFDATSKQILALRFLDYEAEILTYYVPEEANASLEAQLRSWAEYYGLRVQDYHLAWDEPMIAQCHMQDESGTCFLFALSYDPVGRMFHCNAVSEQTTYSD